MANPKWVASFRASRWWIEVLKQIPETPTTPWKAGVIAGCDSKVAVFHCPAEHRAVCTSCFRLREQLAFWKLVFPVHQSFLDMARTAAAQPSGRAVKVAWASPFQQQLLRPALKSSVKLQLLFVLSLSFDLNLNSELCFISCSSLCQGFSDLTRGVVEKDACMLTDNKILPFCLEILVLFKTWQKLLPSLSQLFMCWNIPDKPNSIKHKVQRKVTLNKQYTNCKVVAFTPQGRKDSHQEGVKRLAKLNVSFFFC